MALAIKAGRVAAVSGCPLTESQTMKKIARKLSRELAWIIGIKVVLLLIIWKACFAPHPVHVDAARVADNMLDAAAASQYLEKNNAR
jgi:hypothetical protein